MKYLNSVRSGKCEICKEEVLVLGLEGLCHECWVDVQEDAGFDNLSPIVYESHLLSRMFASRTIAG
jgi:hypothetical protein